jgi:adenylate cyclase
MADAGMDKEQLETYVQEHDIENTLNDLVRRMLGARPENPKQWLLEALENDMAKESQDLTESELHRLFAVTKRISAEIVPRDTIDKIIKETLDLLRCDTVSLFMLDKKSGMLKLFASNLDHPIMVSPGQGLVGTVFRDGETVNIPDCYQDSRFDKAFDSKTGYLTRSTLAMPIREFDETIIGVLQAINKLPPGFQKTPAKDSAGKGAVPFGLHDQKILSHLTEHVGIALRNSEVYREAISTGDRVQGLLDTIQSLSQDLGVQSLLLTITMHANKIVSAQRSTVFLCDEAKQELWSVSTDTGAEIRIPKKAGIAGICCTQGETINIADAYEDSRFNQEVDKRTGFRTQSILAVPMFGKSQDGREQVVGVIQMINKTSYDGQLETFADEDIEVMEMFAKFVTPRFRRQTTFAESRTTNLSEGERAVGGNVSMDQFGLSKEDIAAKKGKRADMSAMKFDEAEEDEET